MRVLVTAQSKHGATAEIAAAIAVELRRHRIEANVALPAQVSSLDGYDAVVLGSAVYMGRWMEQARDFAERFADKLHTIPVWLFSSGPVGDPLKPAEPPADGETVARDVGAREHRVFAGEIDHGDLGLGEKLVVKMVHAPAGDYRPWTEIVDWSGEIADALTGAQNPAARP